MTACKPADGPLTWAKDQTNSVAALFPFTRRSSSELRCQIEAVHQSEFVRCAEAGRCFLTGHTYHRLHVVQNDSSDVFGQIVIEIRCTDS